jgi:ribonuclease BN (tRNA processing enzyme)
MERIVFLGTASACPVPGKRNVSSLCITTNAGAIMVDCGEGTQHQLKLCTAVKTGSIDLILITHLHGDHCFGLFGMLLTVATGRSRPITIVGPEGIKKLLLGVWGLTGSGWSAEDVDDLRCGDVDGDKSATGIAGASDQECRLHFIEIPDAAHCAKVDVTLGCFAATGGCSVLATPLIHSMPCWGYIIEEPGKPGAVDAAKALALGVPAGPLLGRLKQGHCVTVPTAPAPASSPDRGPRAAAAVVSAGGNPERDREPAAGGPGTGAGGGAGAAVGTVVRPEQVVGAPTPGRKVCVLQDSCDSSFALRNGGIHGCSVFIHEATFEVGLSSVSHSPARWLTRLARSLARPPARPPARLPACLPACPLFRCTVVAAARAHRGGEGEGPLHQRDGGGVGQRCGRTKTGAHPLQCAVLQQWPRPRQRGRCSGPQYAGGVR